MRPFDPYGSSIGQRTCLREARGWLHWPWSQPGRYYGRAGYRVAYGGGSRTSNDRCGRADRSALLPTPVGWRFTSADTRGKSARFRGGCCCNPCPPDYRAAFACSLLLDPQPHRLIWRLAFPYGGDYGLTTLRRGNPAWVRFR